MNIRAALVTTAGVVLLVAVGYSGHIPGTPDTAPPAASVATDPGCQATQVATDGTPPPGTPTLDPQKLCDALGQAEQDVACMGDYQPPDPNRVNARQLCIDMRQRGCGDTTRDCDRIPADQTYYTHH